MLRSRATAVARQHMHGTGALTFTAAGRAPEVLAFHGFGGTVAEIQPTLEAVANAGFAVDAPLLPGHGTRIEDLQEQTFASWVDAARARLLAAAARSGRVVLLGFSLGSLVAMHLAADAPPGVVGLVVLGNALTLRPHTSVPMRLWQLTGRPMPDLYLRKPRAADLVDRTLMRQIVTYDHHPMRSALEVYEAGARVRAEVPRVTCPTLILHGRKDLVCHWRNAPWMAEHVGARDVTVRIFEQSGHVLCCDGERDDVAAEVVRFVTRLA